MKKIAVWMALALALAVLPSVQSAITIPNGYAYWPLDGTANDTFNFGQNYIGGANFNASSQYVGTHALAFPPVAQNQSLFADAGESITNVSTISFWINSTDNSPDDTIFAITDGGGNTDGLILWRDGSANFEVRFYINGGLQWQYDAPVFTNAKAMLTFVQEGSLLQLWKNDTIVQNQSISTFMHSDFDTLSIGGGVGGFGTSAGLIDNIVMDKDIWTAADVAAAYNNDAGDTFTKTVASTLSITDLYPDNDTQFNSPSLSINVTTSTTSAESYNVSLYLNNTLNTTAFNISGNTTTSFNFTFSSDADLEFYYYVTVMSASSSANSTNRTFYIDRVTPSINSTVPAPQVGGVWPNMYYKNFTTLTNIIDQNLFSWYINLTTSTGTFLYNWTNQSLTGESELNITQFINMTDLYGVFNLSVTVADGHTKQRIQPFNTRVEGARMSFDDVDITSSDFLMNDLWQYHQVDRHKFGYGYLLPRRSAQYIVESDTPITILNGQTDYPGHLITGNKWIDFANEHVESVSVNRIDSFTVQVDVEFDTALTSIEYSSIGELNIVTQNFAFFMMNASTSGPAATVNNKPVRLTLNTTFDSLFSATGIDASLQYNGTQYEPSITARNDSYNFNVTFIPPLSNDSGTIYQYYWNFTVNGVSYNTSVQTQELRNNASFQIQFRHEVTQAVIPEGVNVSFISDGGQNYEFVRPAGSAPLNVTILIPYNYTIRYSSAAYGQQRQFILAATNATLENMSLYLIPDNISSELTVTVFDSLTIEALSDRIVYLQRYRTSTGTYETVAMYTTDESGKAYFDVEQGTELYKFRIDYPWLTIKEVTEGQYIQASTLNIYTDDQSSVAEHFFESQTISSSLTFNNATRVFSASFTDSESVSTQICLTISTLGQYAKEIVNQSCTSAKSGTITAGGATDPTETYYAELTASINPTIVINSGSVGPTKGLQLGTLGLFLTAAVMTVFVFLVPSHIMAALFAGIGLLASYLWGLFEVSITPVILVIAAWFVLALIMEKAS